MPKTESSEIFRLPKTESSDFSFYKIVGSNLSTNDFKLREQSLDLRPH